MQCSACAIAVASIVLVFFCLQLNKAKFWAPPDPVSMQVLTGPMSYNTGNDQSLFPLDSILLNRQLSADYLHPVINRKAKFHPGVPYRGQYSNPHKYENLPCDEYGNCRIISNASVGTKMGIPYMGEYSNPFDYDNLPCDSTESLLHGTGGCNVIPYLKNTNHQIPYMGEYSNPIAYNNLPCDKDNKSCNIIPKHTLAEIADKKGKDKFGDPQLQGNDQPYNGAMGYGTYPCNPHDESCRAMPS